MLALVLVFPVVHLSAETDEDYDEDIEVEEELIDSDTESDHEVVVVSNEEEDHAGDDENTTDEQTIAELMETLQMLMAQVAELQAQIEATRGQVQEVRKELRAGLREGMSDEMVAEIQKLLATDPDIYPEGLVTGYFGPLTRGALMRLQKRHDLHQTGEVDEETRALLQAYLEEKRGGHVPPGLLRAPGIAKKVETIVIEGDEITINCDVVGAPGALCRARMERTQRGNERSAEASERRGPPDRSGVGEDENRKDEDDDGYDDEDEDDEDEDDDDEDDDEEDDE